MQIPDQITVHRIPSRKSHQDIVREQLPGTSSGLRIVRRNVFFSEPEPSPYLLSDVGSMFVFVRSSLFLAFVVAIDTYGYVSQSSSDVLTITGHVSRRVPRSREACHVFVSFTSFQGRYTQQSGGSSKLIEFYTFRSPRH